MDKTNFRETFSMQICPLMLIFGLSFSPFVNGEAKGKEGETTVCLVPKTCRHPLLSGRLRKGKMDIDDMNVH